MPVGQIHLSVHRHVSQLYHNCVCVCVRECKRDKEAARKEGCVCVHVSAPSGVHPLFQTNPF